MTDFSFGRTDGRTERGNNNIPELSLESAGIISICFGSYIHVHVVSYPLLVLYVVPINISLYLFDHESIPISSSN